MKNYYYVIFYIIILLLILLFFYSNSNITSDLISEEANPIRVNEEIEGMDYTITINEKMKKNNIKVLSEILSSIYHYKDINSIDEIYVDLNLDNQTRYNYILKSIKLVNREDNYLVRNISYDESLEKVKFILNKDDFMNYNNNYCIEIDLEKKYL